MLQGWKGNGNDCTYINTHAHAILHKGRSKYSFTAFQLKRSSSTFPMLATTQSIMSTRLSFKND